jgi:hypothetical protein
MHIFHCCLSMTPVSFQKALGAIASFLALFASTNCLDSGKQIRMKPTPMERPAAIQNTVFQLLVEPPTPRLAQAAQTYPKEYPCCRIPDIRPRASVGQFSRAMETAFPYTPCNNGQCCTGLTTYKAYTHEESKDTSYSQELLESLAVNGCDLQQS